MEHKIVIPISEMGHKIVIPLSEDDVQGLFDLVHNVWASVCYRFTANTGEEVEVRFVKEEEEEDLNK